MQYFNIFCYYLTFITLSLLYQITIKPQNMTNEQLQNEIERLAKKAKSLSRKAYNGDGKFSATLDYYYTRIHQLRAQLNNQ